MSMICMPKLKITVLAPGRCRWTRRSWRPRAGARSPVRPSARIRLNSCTQPAMTTGRMASVEAADSLAMNMPRVVTLVLTQTGTVEPSTGLSCTARKSAIATFFTGGLAIVHDAGPNVTLLVDYTADGDFDDGEEVRTLSVVFTSDLAVAGTPNGVFVLTDTGVFRQILP